MAGLPYMQRLVCKVFGCRTGTEPWQWHHCERCLEDLYSGNFYQEGWGPVRWWRAGRWRWSQRTWYRHHKCDECGKHLYFTDQNCCSPECYDRWIPF